MCFNYRSIKVDIKVENEVNSLKLTVAFKFQNGLAKFLLKKKQFLNNFFYIKPNCSQKNLSLKL